MNRLIRALLIASAATGGAYIMWSRLASPIGGKKPRLVPPVKEVDVESLPEDVRKKLLSELDEQLS
jgi:hypothetical protein